MLEVFGREAGEPRVVAVEEPFSAPILDPELGETPEGTLVGVSDPAERDGGDHSKRPAAGGRNPQTKSPFVSQGLSPINCDAYSIFNKEAS
ncbi:MAG: hypothetical protein ACE5JU_08370 [Candidatus Binatia bacterium]